MKRFAAVLLALWCLLPSAQALETSAQSAVLMDAASGRVLYEKNARQPRDIASITKLMTALVAVERAEDLDEIVTIQPQWTGVEGSSIYLQPGEQVSLRALLYGLLLQSGNDAAVAIAAHCAGDVETFVGWMNERAVQLGMEQTHFANPNGLSQQGHYSTAYDMALLAAACCANPAVAEIAATRSITLEGRTLTNHNKLLWRYPGCTGLKTGYTQLAGRAL
ncbi:MAG: serine hydrolase, partial [Oscillospiraceae bacterium]|nr:serine hydrolase [Oscillospiraceae bacterium]